MSESNMGSVVWQDLTVDNAEQLRDFYAEVIGWESSPVSMGEYEDYSMQTADGQTRAGICHHRGANESIPPQWLLYFKVEDLDKSLEASNLRGGKPLTEVKSYGSNSRYCVIQDPAGAVCALYEEKPE